MNKNMTVDLVCVAPHPDDAELCCGGLLLLAKKAGRKIAIVDCTQGEMATRGSVALRKKESAAADRLLGTDLRINLKLPDGHLSDDDNLRKPLVNALRRLRPRIVLVPHWEDRHPDHAAVGKAAEAVIWLCGASGYAPETGQSVVSPVAPPYRPQTVLYYNNRYGIEADLIVDISPVFEAKLALVACYDSQFGPGPQLLRGKVPQTKLSSERFLEFMKNLHGFYGFKIDAPYGEAYCSKGPLALHSIDALF